MMHICFVFDCIECQKRCLSVYMLTYWNHIPVRLRLTHCVFHLPSSNVYNNFQRLARTIIACAFGWSSL